MKLLLLKIRLLKYRYFGNMNYQLCVGCLACAFEQYTFEYIPEYISEYLSNNTFSK